MAHETSPSLSLSPPLAPSGWRTLPTGASGVHAFRGPSGLTVSVHDIETEEGPARRVIVSRSLLWPTRLELEFVARAFLDGLAFDIQQQHGLGHLAVRLEHRLLGGQGTPAEARQRLEQLALLNEAANARREQSTMRASMARMQIATPPGWRKRPSPLGPPVYDHNGLQVIVCEQERDGQRWATLSVGRNDRKPTLDEAREVARLFLGAEASPTHPEEDQGARKVLVLECRLGGAP